MRIGISTLQLDGKLPPGSPLWEQMATSFVEQDLKAIDLAYSISQGYAFCSVVGERRKREHFVAAQHIGIDLDTMDENSTLAGIQAHPFAYAYGAFAYTTPSHTDDKPRARLVFELDEPITNIEGYIIAIRALLNEFEHADKACSDPVRMFFGNKNAKFLHLCQVLPLSELRYMAAKLVASEKQHAGQNRHQYTTPDAERVREALARIDPYGLDYGRWIGVLAAIKRDFGDAGLPMATSWAKGKPGEVEREFERNLKDHSSPMTCATIFHLAGAAA